MTNQKRQYSEKVRDATGIASTLFPSYPTMHGTPSTLSRVAANPLRTQLTTSQRNMFNSCMSCICWDEEKKIHKQPGTCWSSILKVEASKTMPFPTKTKGPIWLPGKCDIRDPKNPATSGKTSPGWTPAVPSFGVGAFRAVFQYVIFDGGWNPHRWPFSSLKSQGLRSFQIKNPMKTLKTIWVLLASG